MNFHAASDFCSLLLLLPLWFINHTNFHTNNMAKVDAIFWRNGGRADDEEPKQWHEWLEDEVSLIGFFPILSCCNAFASVALGK